MNILSREEVAVKIQPGMLGHSQLAHEFHIYKALAGSNGIPLARWFGTECDYNAMVTDLLGPSLENLFGICKRKFSLKTVLLLADQLVCVFPP
jgi:casein kinase I family protein HRR25